MQAAHENDEPTNDVGNFPSVTPGASPYAPESSHSLGPANSSYRTPIGETLKVWAPVVVTAILVPGGIVIALAILIRRWYRNRAVRPATFA